MNLNGRKHHAPIDVLKLGHDAFADMFALFFILCHISCEGVEHGNPSPLGTLVQRNEELVQDCSCNYEDRWVR